MLAREQVEGPPQVTFVLPADGPGGVGGDFHPRDPAAQPPEARGDGTRAATVAPPAHSGRSFRHPAADAPWRDDDRADGRHGTDSRLTT
ncbi:hypothetical protein SNE510_32930 [Streptomyces sp. NE5-10]|uniref:hypothetical protein n=1 Tax=Streptomyces sp. NE5-10 TaxID=2759674 RepID=UPI0019055A56|nr:hypothetical protein [Streptomyces sp. NE5-10]GHJ93774.1 hypothetical protein SNE510_32930 [Streptomyces sp. NE5-10]